MHQVLVSQLSNRRAPIAHTKGRSEVRGGGKKPWRQKGTGRARHGSRRSPIWRGGGITFGPSREKNYDKKINKKTKSKALITALSQKYRDNEILFLDTISMDEIKTKQAKEILKNLSSVSGFDMLITKKRNTAYIALFDKNVNVRKSFKNFGNIEVHDINNLNVYDILKYKFLIITNPKESVKIVESRTPKKEEPKTAPTLKAKTTSKAKATKVVKKKDEETLSKKTKVKVAKTTTKKEKDISHKKDRKIE